MVSHSELQKIITALDNDPSGLASTKLPAGITRLMLLVMDPPENVWNGTSYSRASELPSEIPLRDDLTLIANLLKHRELIHLVDAILEMPRVSGDQIAMSALNLGDALEQVTEQSTDRNPPFRFSLQTGERIARISIASHDALGEFGPIYEIFAQAIFIRLIMSFLEYAESNSVTVGSITFSCRIIDEDVISRLSQSSWLRVERSGHETSISLPLHLLASPNPSLIDSPEQTATAVAADAEQSVNPSFEITQLERAIDGSLRTENRTLQLDEIARRFGMSQRTLLRRIADTGSTLRQVATDRRMARACELLSDPSLKVSDISSATGYSDPTSFVRAFRRWYGISPHRWRRHARAEASKE